MMWRTTGTPNWRRSSQEKLTLRKAATTMAMQLLTASFISAQYSSRVPSLKLRTMIMEFQLVSVQIRARCHTKQAWVTSKIFIHRAWFQIQLFNSLSQGRWKFLNSTQVETPATAFHHLRKFQAFQLPHLLWL